MLRKTAKVGPKVGIMEGAPPLLTPPLLQARVEHQRQLEREAEESRRYLHRLEDSTQEGVTSSMARAARRVPLPSNPSPLPNPD